MHVMPSRRGLLCIAVLAGAAVVLAAGAWLCWPPRSAITAANAAKIHEGMTRDEVEAILGGPPRFDATGKVSYSLEGIPDVRPIHRAMREWVSDEVLVMVWIGADGRVQRCVTVPVRSESMFATARRQLGF